MDGVPFCFVTRLSLTHNRCIYVEEENVQFETKSVPLYRCCSIPEFLLQRIICLSILRKFYRLPSEDFLILISYVKCIVAMVEHGSIVYRDQDYKRLNAFEIYSQLKSCYVSVMCLKLKNMISMYDT